MIQETFSYDAPGCVHKFTGKERDSESGLDNFGARYYGSSLGRFMTPDWAARPTTVPYAVFGDPQSLNLYNYVRNDPLSRIDPDGHYEVNASGCSGNNQAKCQKKYDKANQRFEQARDGWPTLLKAGWPTFCVTTTEAAPSFPAFGKGGRPRL